MKSKLVRAAVVFAFCTMPIHSLLAQDNCTHPRIISVTGNAEVKVAPDEVSLTLGVDSHDKDLAAAKADNDKRIKKLLNLAHAAGVDPKNIQTSALTMGPEYSEEKIPKLLGYQVSETVTLTLTDLSKYEDLMTNSLRAGVNRVDGIDFFVADPKKYKEEARLKAIQAAREKAVAMAGQLGQTVGKPWEVIEDPDINAQDVTANFNMHYKMAPMQQEQSTVAGGEVTIRTLVRVSFQLD
jgi:uncharacterized protein YggE